MLYDPKWDKQADTKPSLGGLIAWLETKNPREKYDWEDRCGRCLFGQYMAAVGIPWTYHSIRTSGEQCTYWTVSETIGASIAIDEPRTFGAALERARAAVTSTL